MALSPSIPIPLFLAALTLAPGIKVGTVVSNRPGLDPGAVPDLLQKRLAKTLQDRDGLPQAFILRLVLNSQGMVMAVSMDPGGGKPVTDLLAEVKSWRFSAWHHPGLTVLKVPVRLEA